VRGVLVGALALVLLEVLVANPNAQGITGGLAAALSGAVNRFLDPTRPLITAQAKTTAKTTAATTASSSQPTTATTLAQPPAVVGVGPITLQ